MTDHERCVPLPAPMGVDRETWARELPLCAAGRYAALRVQPGVLNLDWQLRFNLFNYFESPDGITRKYCVGEHYWEIGRRGFRVRDVKKRFERFFRIVQAYRNVDWLPSYNFVLQSRHPLQRRS